MNSTILCICLLLLPCHFCHSCLVSFCYVSWVCSYSLWCEKHGFLGLYCLLLFLPGLGHCLGRSSCSSSPMGFHFCCSFSCHAHGPAKCHFCHVGPLDLLPLSQSSYDPFTLLLPLVVPISLLAVILVMLAH